MNKYLIGALIALVAGFTYVEAQFSSRDTVDIEEGDSSVQKNPRVLDFNGDQFNTSAASLEVDVELNSSSVTLLGGTIEASEISDQNAGTDITSDLEEETHASEHQNGGADEISVTGLSGLLADTQEVSVSTDGTVVGVSTGINFVSGSNITLTGSESGNEIQLTIAASTSGDGYNVEPATVTFQLDQGFSASTAAIGGSVRSAAVGTVDIGNITFPQLGIGYNSTPTADFGMRFFSSVTADHAEFGYRPFSDQGFFWRDSAGTKIGFLSDAGGLNVSSVTVTDLTAGQCVQVNASGHLSTSGSACGSGASGTTIEIEDGGSSIVATSTLNFTGGEFIVTDDSGEALIRVDPSSVTTAGQTIDDTEMTNEDFGDWTCTGSEDGCTLDNDVVAAAEMADADHGDVSWSGGVATVDNVAAANVAAGSLGASVLVSSVAQSAVGTNQIIDDTIVPADVDETQDYSYTTISGKQDRNNTAVDDDSCVGEQGLWWYDTTDSQFEFCNADSGAPSAIPSTPGDITDVFDCASGDCNDITVESGETLDVAAGGEVHATETHLSVNNDSGATLYACTAVYLSGFDIPSDLPEVDWADAGDAARMPAIGIIESDIANGADGKVVILGTHESLDTNTGEGWSVGDNLYVEDIASVPTSADCGGNLTSTKPTGEGALIQKLGEVARVNAANGEITVFGAGRSNDTPNLDSAAIFVGNSSNQAAAVDVTGDVTISNTGVTTIGADQVEESMLKAVNSATDEYVLTYESTTGDFEWVRDIKNVILKVSSNTGTFATGDSAACFVIPIELTGMNLVSVGGHVYTASSSGLPNFMIRNQTDTADMLSTAITIDANEKDSATATTAAVINTATDDVVTGDEVCVDVDGIGTSAKGAEIRLGFALP